VLEFLFPQRCVVCGTPGPAACEACLGRLRRIRPPLCARCGAPTAWPVRRCVECAGRRLAFAAARAAVVHDEAARALVAGWKHRSLRRLAAASAAVVAQALEPPPGAAALVPVPPDPERVLERAHHPAEALARELGARWDLPLQPLLTRRHARPQRGLSRVERRRNVATVRAGNTRAPPRVVLVDDVYTTGATVSAAASALRRAGAREVHVITFSRASRGGGFG
jgi:predicted amidophosphoribosyltransferase